MVHEDEYISARQAAAEFGYSERTARWQAAKAFKAGAPEVQKAGTSWLAPRWWWRLLLETPDPAARRPRKKKCE